MYQGDWPTSLLPAPTRTTQAPDVLLAELGLLPQRTNEGQVSDFSAAYDRYFTAAPSSPSFVRLPAVPATPRVIKVQCQAPACGALLQVSSQPVPWPLMLTLGAITGLRARYCYVSGSYPIYAQFMC